MCEQIFYNLVKDKTRLVLEEIMTNEFVRQSDCQKDSVF